MSEIEQCAGKIYIYYYLLPKDRSRVCITHSDTYIRLHCSCKDTVLQQLRYTVHCPSKSSWTLCSQVSQYVFRCRGAERKQCGLLSNLCWLSSFGQCGVVAKAMAWHVPPGPWRKSVLPLVLASSSLYSQGVQRTRLSRNDAKKVGKGCSHTPTDALQTI